MRLTAADQEHQTGLATATPVGPVATPDIYWANSSNNTIGRANLDGTGANQSFITGASFPMGLALTPP
jgi:hypothetical protein